MSGSEAGLYEGDLERLCPPFPCAKAGFNFHRNGLLSALGVLLFAIPTASLGAGKINYGSRAGMQVSVVSISGLDTARAVITTKHTRQDAIAYCRDYEQKVTPECIKREMNTRLNDQIIANCKTGEFTDFHGGRYRFAGPSRDKASMAKFRVVDLATGEQADGSMASGYYNKLEIFKALCPSTAPSNPYQ